MNAFPIKLNSPKLGPLFFPFAQDKSTLHDGVDEDGDAGHVADVSFGNSDPFFVALWIKLADNNANTGFVSQWGGGGGEGFVGWLLDKQMNTGRARFILYGDAANVGARIHVRTTSTTTLTVARGWTHIICQHDGSGVASGTKIYIDGINTALTTIVDSLGTDMTSSTAPLRIGSYGVVTPISFMRGNMDETIIGNKFLSDVEALELYNLGKGFDINTFSAFINCLHWWRHGDGQGDSNLILNDQIGTAHFTLRNMEPADIVADVP